MLSGKYSCKSISVIFVLTLDRWASSISRKESVVLGSGRIVTTMIFELTTVKFLYENEKMVN